MTSVASWFSCEFPCRSNSFVSLWMRYYLNSWTSQLHVNFDAGFSQPGPGAPRPPLESMSLSGGHGFWRTCLETRFTHGNLHMMSDVYSSGKCFVSKLDAIFCMENPPLTNNHRAWWRGSCRGHDFSATWLLLRLCGLFLLDKAILWKSSQGTQYYHRIKSQWKHFRHLHCVPLPGKNCHAHSSAQEVRPLLYCWAGSDQTPVGGAWRRQQKVAQRVRETRKNGRSRKGKEKGKAKKENENEKEKRKGKRKKEREKENENENEKEKRKRRKGKKKRKGKRRKGKREEKRLHAAAPNRQMIHCC